MKSNAKEAPQLNGAVHPRQKDFVNNTIHTLAFNTKGNAKE